MVFTANKKLVSLVVLSIGTAWIYLNIFWSVFYVFAQAIEKPWLFLNGFVLFKDLIWNRAGFELYLLAGFYKLFGINPLNFQIFIFLCQTLIGFVIFGLLYKKSFWLAVSSYTLYVAFAFLVYGSITESAEILIGLFVFLILYFYWEFIEKKNLKYLFLAGLATGLSLITKQTSLFIPFSVIVLLIIYSRKQLIKKSICYLSGTAFPVLMYVSYFIWNDALLDLYQNTIYNVLFVYRETAPSWGLSEGIRMVIFHLTVLIPFTLMNTDKFVSKPVKTALIIFVLSLFTTLLPTYWAYRLVSALPIFSVITSIFFVKGYMMIRKANSYILKLVVIFLFITFLLQFKFYFDQNIGYVVDNGGYSPRQYIFDGYSDDEKEIVAWLRNNTKTNERILNMASSFVYYYSGRYPSVKYDDSIYFGILKLDQYYGTITKNPARVVIYDSDLPSKWPILKNWKYVAFLKENYDLVKTVGIYKIYVLKNLQAY